MNRRLVQIRLRGNATIAVRAPALVSPIALSHFGIVLLVL